MVDILHLDYETKSDHNIKQVGLDVYTSPKSNPDVLMAAYSINDGPTQHWEKHKRRLPPAELQEALEDPDVEKWAFNAQFERVTTNRVLKIKSPIKGWRCSMVLAYMQCFMGGLADVGMQVGLPEDKQKQKEGSRFIKIFTVPQKITTNQPHLWRNWKTDPQLWQGFCGYNIQDNDSERALRRRLINFPVPAIEWEFYELDQEINDRGIPIDEAFINSLIWMAARRKRELMREMQDITHIKNPNSRDQLLPWLKDHGYPMSDIRQETIQKVINQSEIFFDCKPDVPDYEAPDIMKVLRRRIWLAKTSINKANKAQVVADHDDGVVRYLFQFGGATRTLRFAGRLVQPQNLMRTPPIFDPEHDDENLIYVTDIIRYGDYDNFELFVSEPMMALCGCMRGMFRAPDFHEFVAADLSSIESAVIAWITGCERLLNVFRTGLDPYLDFGMEFYSCAYDKIDRAMRQMCKPPALGCGFRMSAGKIEGGVKTGLLKYADGMNIPMTLEQAERAVRIYRETYPEIVKFWYACERAFRQVIETHKPVKLGFVTFKWMKPYVLIELPSGRNIFYYKPRLEMRRFFNPKNIVRRKSLGWEIDGHEKGEMIDGPEIRDKMIFTYMGKRQSNGQWVRLDSHGGLITENIVQATARDILREGMFRAHNDGFQIVSHAHDEIVALRRKGDNYFSKERIENHMKAPIDWAPGLPLGAKGWVGDFYRK